MKVISGQAHLHPPLEEGIAKGVLSVYRRFLASPRVWPLLPHPHLNPPFEGSGLPTSMLSCGLGLVRQKQQSMPPNPVIARSGVAAKPRSHDVAIQRRKPVSGANKFLITIKNARCARFFTILDCHVAPDGAPRNDGLEHGAKPALQSLETSLHDRLINKEKYFGEMIVDLWVNLSLEGEDLHWSCAVQNFCKDAGISTPNNSIAASNNDRAIPSPSRGGLGWEWGYNT